MKAKLEKAKAPDQEEDTKESPPGDQVDGESDGESEGQNKEEMAKKACKKACKKGEDLTEDDLKKSLDKLENLTKGEGVPRKQALLEKAQTGELSKSEREELFELLGQGEAPAAPKVGDGLLTNDTIQKSLDVSDFLQESTSELVKALNALDGRINESDERQHEFNLILAKALAETGRMVAAMSERLGVVESQPARPPKSAGLAPLEKSFAGQTPASETISKAEILDAMSDMIVKAGGYLPDGTDLVVAASKYEQFSQISPNVLNAVQGFIKESAH